MKTLLLILFFFLSIYSYSQDTDGDGVLDNIDNCILIPNPTQDDGDFDGVGDECDVCLGDDATGDTDNDGICDDLDFCIGDDATGDTDNDGICDDLDTLSIPDIEKIDLKLFPNPASNYLNINYPIDKKYTIKLYNTLGKVVIESSLKIIDLNKLPSGVYFLNAIDDSVKKRIVNKIIIKK